MAFTRIHHVGIVTPDLDVAKQVLVEGFGLGLNEHRTPWPDGGPGSLENVTTLEFPIGEMYYEVSKPKSDSGEAAAYLESSGGRGGMYYISIASNDIAADVRGLTARGAKVQGSWDGSSAVFLDHTTTLGLRIQITPEDSYFAHPYYKGTGVVTGMAHIGVAARSADEVRNLFGTIFDLEEDKSMERGLEPRPADQPARAADDPVHLLEYPVGGSVIEISIPTTDTSGTAKLVAQRATLGATYHHTCPFAPDVHAFTEQAVAAGIQQIGSIPPKEQNPRVVAWFHPRSCLGMLVELWNRPPGGQHYHRHPSH